VLVNSAPGEQDPGDEAADPRHGGGAHQRGQGAGRVHRPDERCQGTYAPTSTSQYYVNKIFHRRVFSSNYSSSGADFQFD